MEVLLCKGSLDDDLRRDLFLLELQNAGVNAEIIPVLDFEFANNELLLKKLLVPEEFSGLIFTSPRGVKATCLAVQRNNGVLPTAWKQNPTFVVGEITAKKVEELLKLKSEGSNCGSAEVLADLILKEKFDKPFLHPCGNLKRDTLSNKLSKGGILVEEVVVYTTEDNQHLGEFFKDISNNGTVIPQYIVFFSPSGVKSTLPVLKTFSVNLESIKVIAIGGTTKAALDEEGINVWKVPAKPTPTDLLNLILRRDLGERESNLGSEK